MRKVLALLVGALWGFCSSAATVFQAPYGVQNEFPFEIWSTDGLSLDVDETDAGSDVTIRCNDNAEATSTNDYTDEGTTYQIILTATEMQCEHLTVTVNEAVDAIFHIETYGNASARNISIPNAAPGAAGALLVAGNNDDFNVTNNVSFADGVTIARSTSNQPGLSITGNGTGNGATITSGSGATGTGLALVAASTNGAALTATGTGTGNGATFTSGSGATGNGASFSAASTNGHGAAFTGTGTGNGITGSGGSTSGEGLNLAGGGTGDGLLATSGAGATGNGATFTAASTNGNGLAGNGTGTGSGALLTAGATGDGLEGIGGSTSGAGVRYAGTAGNSPAMNLVGQGSAAGLLSTGGATGAGASFVGGATSGAGFLMTGTAGNSPAASFVGQGSAAGALFTGGATGAGMRLVGGATSGAGLAAVGTAGNSPAFSLAGQGSASGLEATGGATGHGMLLTGGSTSGNAIGTSITAPIGPIPEYGILESGTLVSATSTTAVLRAATNFADDFLNCAVLEIIQGTGVGQRRVIDDWTGTTPADTATVTTWTTTPDSTSDYVVYAAACGSSGSLTAADVWSYGGGRTLSAGTNIVLAKGTGITGFNDLDSTAVQAAAAAALNAEDGGNFTAADDAVMTRLGAPTDLGGSGASIAGMLTDTKSQMFHGEADGGDTNTLVDAALSTPFTSNVSIDGAYVERADGQRCFIDSYVAATGTVEFGSCTFTGAWSTQRYKLYPAGTQ
jgi:hypothetical protein